MMRCFLVGLAAFSIAAAGGDFQAAQAEGDSKFTEGMKKCWISKNEYVPHEKGYEWGKSAAIFINTWYLLGDDLKPDTGDETEAAQARKRDFFLRTREWFAKMAVLTVQKMGSEETAGCLSAQLRPLEKQAWSSVHSGLTDHLEPELKTHFFSVPER